MTPQEAARIRAEEIHRIWGVDRPQPLGNAHRLLDVDLLANVVLTLMVRIAREADHEFPVADATGRYYRFPHWPRLLPALQEWTWGQILAGKLVLTGILTDQLITGDRVTIPPERLRFLRPDWADAILRAEGRAFVHDVMVHPPAGAAEPPKSTTRRHVPEPDLQHCGNEIKKNWQAGSAPPSEQHFAALIQAKLGWVARERLRTLRRNLGWSSERGRPRKK
jgi:hypothetical protein